MASLDDIPDELLDENKQSQFLDWLESVPLTHQNQLEFLGMWTRLTQIPFTFGQVESLKAKSIPPDQFLPNTTENKSI